MLRFVPGRHHLVLTFVPGRHHLVQRFVPGTRFGVDYYQKFSDFLNVKGENEIFSKFSLCFMWSPNIPLSYTKSFSEMIGSL